MSSKLLLSLIPSHRTIRAHAVSFLLLLVIAVCQLSAQIDRGTIQGLVTDSSGAVVPSAKVQVVKIDTNTATNLATNGAGLYTAPNMPLGTYRLIFQAPGFGQLIREPVEVGAGTQVRVDVTLTPGAVSDSVTISAEAPLVDVATISNTAGFKSALVQELPLITVGLKRDITLFILNLPGANPTGDSLNGAVAGNTEVFIDGAPGTERLLIGSIKENGPFLEMVGEYSVSANAFNAEYGGFGSFFTNVTIKSGTNQLHGSAFDHLGNGALNSRSFFQPVVTPYKQNEAGFNIGGPIVFPKIYNGRNKTFFFGALGLFYARIGASNSIITIPTQAMLKGDFSGFAGANGVQIPIFDPDTTVPDGKGSFVRTQFPGNVIPANRIVGFAKIINPYYPATDLPGVSNNFYNHAPPSYSYFNNPAPLVKIDHSLSTKQKLSGSYTFQSRHRLIWGTGVGPQPQWGEKTGFPLDSYFDQIADSWKYRINHDYVISANLLNHLTLSADRYWNYGFNKTAGEGWPEKLGIKGLPPGIPQYSGQYPQVSFTGGTGSPVNQGRGYDENWHEFRYSIIDNLAFIHGTHTMKFGVELDRERIRRLYQGGSGGLFNFSNQMTSQPNSSALGTQGSSVASYLLGQLQSASADQGVDWGVRYPRYALFAQDEWHITKALTVSYGLRWDYDVPYYEVQNKLVSFVPGLPNPGAGGRPGALGFAGTGPGRVGNNFQNPWRKGFGPRLGIAYQLNPKTVIRASGGIYYAKGVQSGSPVIYGFGNTPTFTSPDGYTQVYNLATGTFPAVPALPSLDPSLRNGQSINYIPSSGDRSPQIISYTFSIQREIARDLSLEATYIGSRSTHLGFVTNYNTLPLSVLQYGSLLLQPVTSPAAAAGGFSSPYPAFASQLGANTVYQSLKPFPQYTTITTSNGGVGGSAVGGVADPTGQNKYNSLQIKANKRFSNGLSLLGFYTWSKSFSRAAGQFPDSRFWQLDANPAAVLSFSWAYQLPFGKDKSLLNTNSKVLNAIVSGWKINGFVRYTDGVPLTITGAGGSLGQLGYTQWATAVTGVTPYGTTNARDFDPATSRYLNPAAFKLSTGFNFGNLAPNTSWIRGFTSKSESLTLGRVFKIRERGEFDLSADAVNPFNFVRWNNPATNLASPSTFGVVTGTATGRTIQINAKLSF